MQNFQWLIKNKVEFPRETKKNSCEMSRGLVFLVFKFSWDIIYIILPNFHGLSLTIDLNWSYKALARIEALTLCQDRAFASFSYFLSLLSVLERFTHLYCDTDSLGRGAPPCMGSKAPTHPLYIHYRRQEKTDSLTASYKPFLSDIEVKTWCLYVTLRSIVTLSFQ